MKTDKVKDLEYQLELAKRKLDRQLQKQVLKDYNLRIGDEVEFSSWCSANYKHVWCKSEIIGFEKHGRYIFTKLDGRHENVVIEELTKFKEDDFSLRNEIWSRSLVPGDEVCLQIEKPGSTKGKIYQIFRVSRELGSDDEYTYYDDEGKLQTLCKGEYHMTHL